MEVIGSFHSDNRLSINGEFVEGQDIGFKPSNIISEEFNFTGSPQTFIVPEGVNSIYVEAFGASGGGASGYGLGGRTVGNISVTPGQELLLCVGGKGETKFYAYDNRGGGKGGWNGGGDGGVSWDEYNATPENPHTNVASGGGGATDIRMDTSLESRIIVAGGGGASSAGFGTKGGDGGGLSGEASPDFTSNGSTGGTGGTQTEGGIGGISGSGGKQIHYPATNGSLGQGGHGATVKTYGDNPSAGGGGGGGYYGGGGGPGSSNWSRASGAGGGSSYFDESYVVDAFTEPGVNDGDGKIIIQYGEKGRFQVQEVVENESALRLMNNRGSIIVPNKNGGLSPAQQMTWELWFKIDHYDQYDSLMGFQTNNWDVRMDSTTFFTCHTYDTSGSWAPTNPTWPSPVNDGEWHHLAIVWDGFNGIRRAYSDGVLSYNATMGKGIMPRDMSAFQNFYIGSAGGSRNTDGWYKEVRIWEVARTHEEILANMHTSLSGDETGLKLYMPLNSISDVAIDKASGFNGTIQNGSWEGGEVKLFSDSVLQVREIIEKY